MDGYESAEHMRQAVIESLPELLDSSAITSKVLWVEDAADFEW